MRAATSAARLVHGLHWSGVGSLPEDGAYILAANHPSGLEPFFLGAAFEQATGDQIHFLANKEFWEDYVHIGEREIHTWPLRYLAKPLLNACGAIPVDRNRWFPRATLKRLDRTVDQNGILGIFPEGGTRAGHIVAPLKTGAAILAARYDIPIVPAGIAGSNIKHGLDEFPRFGHIHVHFGEPITPSADKREMTQTLQGQLQSAVDIAYHLRDSAA